MQYTKWITALSCAILLASCYSVEPQKTGLEGKAMPDFNLLLSDSTSFNTRNIATDKPVALFLFSPVCPYCRAQMEEIIEDQEKLKGIHFYLTTPFPYANMKKFYEEFQLQKYPNITVSTDTANAVGDYFEAKGVPYIAVYGKDKKLNKAFVGKIYSSQIKEAAED